MAQHVAEGGVVGDHEICGGDALFIGSAVGIDVPTVAECEVGLFGELAADFAGVGRDRLQMVIGESAQHRVEIDGHQFTDDLGQAERIAADAAAEVGDASAVREQLSLVVSNLLIGSLFQAALREVHLFGCGKLQPSSGSQFDQLSDQSGLVGGQAMATERSGALQVVAEGAGQFEPFGGILADEPAGVVERERRMAVGPAWAGHGGEKMCGLEWRADIGSGAEPTFHFILGHAA